MKHAICIQCHNIPEIINFWINNLPSEHFDFYIHVDKKSNIADLIVKKRNVTFVERVDVRWGQYSQVTATLNLLRATNKKSYSYVHLISGNDIFIKDPIDFLVFFEKNTGYEFIQSNEIGYGKCSWSWGGEDRYSVYYPLWMIKRPTNKIFRSIRVAYREFIMRTKIFKRKGQPVDTFYGGSSWFLITGNMSKWIIEYLDANPSYFSFFKHGVCVDEVFFSTLVRLSPYNEKIANEHLRFMDWNNKGKSSGPIELTLDDWSRIEESGKVFARKVTDIVTVKIMWNRANSR